MLTVIIALANIALWAGFNRPKDVPEFSGKIGGFAYSPYQRYQGPLKQIFPSLEDIDGDLALLATRTDRIRTYSSLENPAIPALAKKHGLMVLAGTYLDRRLQRNDDEIAALVNAVRSNDNIDRVMVGNETLHRQDMGVSDLIEYIDRVRAQLPSRIAISTAEPPYVWLKYPQLAKHVDFITVHLLPYWEAIPRKDAVGIGVLGNYVQMQSAFPGKKIVIGEVGWPSAGDRNKVAMPSIEDEAQFIRQWVKEANWRKIDYYLMEAFDQPWKENIEGRVGAYWGTFAADRTAKFSFTGRIVEGLRKLRADINDRQRITLLRFQFRHLAGIQGAGDVAILFEFGDRNVRLGQLFNQ